MNIALLLEMVAGAAPDRVVVGPTAGGLTAGELLRRSRQAAARFLAGGAEHVAVVDLNSEAVPIALFGAAMAGLPFAPVNYRLADEQLEGILRRLVPCVAVAGPEDADRLPRLEGMEVVTRAAFLDECGRDGDADGDLPFVDPDEIAVLLFTSGTTGEPKAAVLRHRHLTAYIIESVECLGADEAEAQLVSVPAYHVAGISAVLSSLYGGRRIVYLPGFDPDEWVDTVQEQHVTQAMVVPTMLGRILHAMDEHEADLSSLRHLSYGGGRMPVDLIEQAMARLPQVDFVNAYGLTETASTVSVLTPDDHRSAFASDDPAVRRRLGSVGRPLPSIELEIRDAQGVPVGPGEVGEVHVRGEQVAGEYLGRSALTEDGWFPTRDAGWVDEEGFLFLEGRLDDVIVRGAENLSPGEIEAVLLGHPAVAEVAVVGVPDEEWGEAVAAAVVLGPDAEASEDELKAWVRERLRSTRTPEVIQFRAAMPYNETGKLLRRVLREELSPTA